MFEICCKVSILLWGTIHQIRTHFPFQSHISVLQFNLVKTLYQPPIPQILEFNQIPIRTNLPELPSAGH